MSSTLPHPDSTRSDSLAAAKWAPGVGLERLHEEAGSSFRAAARASGRPAASDFLVAGRRLRVLAADDALLRRLSRTFGHLRAGADGEPELTIHVWDSTTRGIPAPPTPDVGDEQAPGAFFYASDTRLRVGFQLGTSGDERVLAVYPDAPTPALSVLDREERLAWYWVEDAGRIPYWEEATPFRYLLDWWLREDGAHQLHAGAVGTPEGGVLIVGKSGSGKSTAALSALQSELLYGGDDYVAVSLEPEPWVHSLYSSGKLMGDHVRLLPFLLASLANPDELESEKAVVYVNEHWPENTAAGFPLRAILAAKVVPGLDAARLAYTSRLDGLRALAPSTVFQMHTRGSDSLSRMRMLAEQIPSYRLELGSDMASIPRAISVLLERLNASARG